MITKSQDPNSNLYPSEIQDALSEIPKLKNLKVRPGPTFIEYKWKSTGTLVGMWVIAAIFIGAGIGLCFETWWGLFFAIAGMLPLGMAIKLQTTKKYTFVLDYATRMVYNAEKDIPWDAIQKLFICTYPYEYTMSNSRGGNSHYTDDVFGLVLSYTINNQSQQTAIFRVYSTDLKYWIELGTYMVKLLTKTIGRVLTLDINPRPGQTGESCAHLVDTGSHHQFSF